MNKEIRRLLDKIEEEKHKIKKCDHKYSEHFDNPEAKKEAYGYKMIKQGSDVWGEPEGYRDITVPRWTRICNLCDFEQHTYERKPVITGHVPDFK